MCHFGLQPATTPLLKFHVGSKNQTEVRSKKPTAIYDMSVGGPAPLAYSSSYSIGASYLSCSSSLLMSWARRP